MKELGDKTRKFMPNTICETLNEVGFKPIGRRIIAGQMREARPRVSTEWFAPVVAFLSDVLPSTSGQWQHLHIGDAACEALVRLGHPSLNSSGANCVSNIRIPEIPPRWDDIATIVICAAGQSGILAYRPYPGTRPLAYLSGLAPANIRAAHGSGPAYLEPRVIPAFESLGLIRGGRWTEAAETVLWRDRPTEWATDFTLDNRFVLAADLAATTVPQEIADQINKVTTIRKRDVIEWLALAELHASTPKTRQNALKSLRFWCIFELDGIFHRRWRLTDGWLDADEEKRAIYLPYDPVALNMRVAFAVRYLPELSFLQNRGS